MSPRCLSLWNEWSLCTPSEAAKALFAMICGVLVIDEVSDSPDVPIRHEMPLSTLSHCSAIFASKKNDWGRRVFRFLEILGALFPKVHCFLPRALSVAQIALRNNVPHPSLSRPHNNCLDPEGGLIFNICTVSVNVSQRTTPPLSGRGSAFFCAFFCLIKQFNLWRTHAGNFA